MRLKKNWAKVLSSALAVTITLSGTYGMPITAFAATDNSDAIVQSDDAIGTESTSTDITSEFESKSYGAPFKYDEGSKTITMGNNNDNHLAAYKGLAKKTNSFVLEADVNIVDGTSAALVFGNGTKKNPFMNWAGANIDTSREKETFRLFGLGMGDISDGKGMEGIDKEKTLHFKLDIDKDGKVIYTFGNKDKETRSINGEIPNWKGAWVGILTWQSEAKFSNISFTNRATEDDESLKDIKLNGKYATNLGESASTKNGTWEITDEGLHSDASGKGDAFLYYSETKGKNFVYSTDVTFKSTEGAASLIFRNGSDKNAENCYVVNIDAASKECKLWRWEEGFDNQLIDAKKVTAAEGNKYTLKVVAIDSWISYYVNDELVASSGDYTLQEGDKGQNTFLSDGYFGLLNWNGEMVFQNTYYSEIDEKTPLLNDIKITSSTGTVEKETQFVPTEPITIQYVKNNADTVNIEVNKKSSDAQITIKDEAGKEYTDGKNIPVKEGKNYITITSSVQTDKNVKAELTYRVNVHRRQQDEVYYNELYRDQYHYSVKDGWANDPNGMVYYKGKYHLFYQFYDDIKWGPMHWAHATSTDMIHWDEEPIAFYPDANGAMFSGCIVVDEKNTSGLFGKGEEGGLVALITADGGGQRIKLAYSTDEGTTWTKVDKIAADWTDDPLRDAAFRDPKVFRWEGKWFMVVAGGPLRIYSSDNLKEWKCESAYPDLHTECPDLYPVKATDGTLKWVLSRGGRFYKVGNFKEVDGKWTFIADNGYNASNENKDSGIMNFGHDSYAAMTFYSQDFGTSASPTIPDIVEINWMNTWDDYCNEVAKKTGEQFNGTFNLALKLGLAKEGDKYVLTQTPVNGYETLRDTAVIDIKDKQVSADNDLLKDFKENCYEIVSKFKPASGTKKVGFKLRTGNDEETLVEYDVVNEKLSIDRSKSGIVNIGNRFKDIDSQAVTLNEDGTIDLHIYVDMASVEVFAKGYSIAGAEQIFPSINSRGASVFVEGEAATADIAIYPMKSIWKEKIESKEPIKIASSSQAESNINVGDKLDLSAYLLPVDIEQDITWSVDNKDIISIEADASDKTICHIKGLAEGEATVTATATGNTSLKKEFKVNVYENNFDTNIKEFTANGNWFIKGDILSVSNTAANDSYMAVEKIPYKEYTLETELKYENGLINIFFASKSTDPNGAYAIQLGDSDTIRLFRFAIDGDIKISTIAKKLNDNQFHKVKVDKTQDSVTVFVDGTECLTHKFDDVEDFYNDAYVGLGLWDGALEVKSFNVKSSSSSIVLNGPSTIIATPVPTATPTPVPTATPTPVPTATATPVPTATATSVPTATASATPDVTGDTTPSATPVPSGKPSATGTPSVTGSPVATNPPADSTATPSSEVKKGTKVTVKDISYKVTSIGSTKTVKYTSAKKDVKKAVVPAAIKINGKKYKVTVIAKNAFKGNKKLTKVTIGKNVKSIGKNAFKGCKNLKKIVVKTKKLTAKKVGNNAFKGINSNVTVKVPKNKVKAYKKIFKAKGAGKNIKVTK